jgi:hypothetical protein
MATRMQQRRGTAAQWTAANPVLAAGEIGFETDTNKFKMGNGSSAWSALQYFANAAELAAIIDGAPDLLNTLNELAASLGDDPAFITTITTSLSEHSNDTTGVHGINNTAHLALSADVTTEIGTAITTHNTDTMGVHGIADTSLLATTGDVNTATTGAASALSAHASETENVHGIVDTANLLTTTHSDATTSVHGIADTSLLATTGDVNTATTAAASALSAHESDTTDVHGIVDTSLLATTGDLTGHNSETENVHGIVDTTVLVTQQQLTDAVSGAEVDQATLAGVGIDWNSTSEQFDIDSTVATKTYADDAVSTHNSDTTNVHGIVDTSLLATTADVAAVTAASLGLGNVDNTSDADKPVSTATVTAIATAKSEAIAEVTAVIDGAPNALNTLNELAAALGDDANFASTVTTSLAAKVDSYTPITQKTASYTLSTLDHRDDLIEMGSSSALTLTIPLNSSIAYPVGTSFDILQTGTGQVTIAGAAGVTVNATPGLKLRTQWSSATLFKRAENTWVVYGDLTA